LDPELFSWILSVLGALLAFVAIFTALETFYVQDWLAKSSVAEAAYTKVDDLAREVDDNTKEIKSLGNDDKRVLDSSQAKINDAASLFPGALVAFFAVIGLATTTIAAWFYSVVSSAVDSGILYFGGFAALIMLFVAILFVVLYSFLKHSKIKEQALEVEKFAKETKKYTRLEDVRKEMQRKKHETALQE